MHASHSRVMVSLLPLCAVALLLSPASADQAVPGPVAGDDKWRAGSPAEAPVAVVAPKLEGTEDEASADGIAAATERHNNAALSPEARRALDHEALCGPRVPVRPGFPWPGLKNDPRCRDNGGGNAAAAAAAADAPLQYPFPIWNP